MVQYKHSCGQFSLGLSSIGLGYSSTRMHQMAESANLFLGHLRLNDTTGGLGQIVLQQTQLEIGSSCFFWSLDLAVWSTYCSQSLITFWWREYWAHGMTIAGTNAWVPQPLWEKEKSRMDIVLPHFDGIALKEINAVRLYEGCLPK